MNDKLYTLNETFDVLKKYKITTHKESVRRWLREGALVGIQPTSKKSGWRVREEDLNQFIQKKLPLELIESKNSPSNTTYVAKEKIQPMMH
jgi:hypothetical protein